MSGTYRFASHLSALFGLSLLALTSAGHAQTALSTLHSFSGSDGATPHGNLVQASDGNLYGTCESGGAFGDGTVFKITTSGALTALHSFTGADGANPEAGLIQASDGNLYGTCDAGGANNAGTVFKITTSGALTVLHSFSADRIIFGNADGAHPQAGLIQASDGNLYGTCVAGGTSNDGTVFKITTSGAFTTLHSFYFAGGAAPEADLIQASDGNLYGTCSTGGANYSGTAFQITTSGALATIHSFGTAPGGDMPYAGLVQGRDGTLYGACDLGGVNGAGMLFKSTTTGTMTTLYNFSAMAIEGEGPVTSLIQGSNGTFYGTCPGGGNGDGTIFGITPSGALSVLYTFSIPRGTNSINADGAVPEASLIQGKDANLYGTCSVGGASGLGTVFKRTMTPIITGFSTYNALWGGSVTLAGVNFTGATSVKIGSLAASFKVNSDASLTLTVPNGAVTAMISVTTPLGTGVSAATLKVTP